MNTTERDPYEGARDNAAGWLASIKDMICALGKADLAREAACLEADRHYDEARQTIEESALSVMVRDGWRSPGAASKDGPDEYEILLSTGGPALRIFGRLDQHCQPSSAELQMQDWGTPWGRCPAPEATLLAFASVFWFGE